MAEFKDSTSALIADVDCTAEGKSLCKEAEVNGVPNLRYGNPKDIKNLQEYTGGRSFRDLKRFVLKNFGPQCDRLNFDLCEPEHTTKIKELMAMSVTDLRGAAEERKATMAKLEADFDVLVEGLTKEFEEALTTKENALEVFTHEDLRLMKSVLARAQLSSSEL